MTYQDNPQNIPAPARHVKVTIAAQLKGEWCPVNSLFDSLQELLLDEICYLNDEDPFGPTERWGFFLEVDGTAWNPNCVENNLHVQAWIHGLAQLVSGQECVPVWAWEESNCTLRRFGERVTLVDWHGDKVICPKVNLCLQDLVRSALQPAADFVQLRRRAARLAQSMSSEHQVILEDLIDPAVTDQLALEIQALRLFARQDSTDNQGN